MGQTSWAAGTALEAGQEVRALLTIPTAWTVSCLRKVALAAVRLSEKHRCVRGVRRGGREAVRDEVRESGKTGVEG